MKPSICRMVVIKGIHSNGSDEHPAIVNHVGSDGSDGSWVNVTVFPDCGAPQCQTSVSFRQDRAAAEQYLSEASPGALVAFWPDRVS